MPSRRVYGKRAIVFSVLVALAMYVLVNSVGVPGWGMVVFLTSLVAVFLTLPSALYYTWSYYQHTKLALLVTKWWNE